MAEPPLPPELAAALRPVLPDLARDTVAAIGREVPDYARPLEGPFGKALRDGVQLALARFVDGLAGPAVQDDARTVYVALGRGERRAGRSLDALLAAYRLGARLAWEAFQRAAVQAEHPPEVVYGLAGAIFSYIDAISAESVEGYAEEQARTGAERGRRRRALSRALSTGESPGGLTELAATAGWPLPATLAALVLAGGEEAEVAAGRLGHDVLVARQDEVVVAWVPDPDAPGRRGQLEALLGAQPAVLGPGVPIAGAPASLRRATTALAVLRPEGLLVADEHLLALLLGGPGQAGLLAALAARELAPLDALAPGPREKLAATLAVWLDHPGQVQPVAERLDVHPQTVRYRLGTLRELFGSRLEDPDARFALAVALRGRAMVGPR